MDINNLDFGPLAVLLGTWKGTSGTDVAPDPDGKEENAYYETITFEAIDTVVSNAEKQKLMAVRYTQVVRRKSDDSSLHDETGYWIWEPETNKIIQTLLIPRAVGVMNEGTFSQENETYNFTIFSKEIFQSSFMKEQAATKSFEREFSVNKTTLKYRQTTMVDIYGNTFEHIDENTLTKIK